MSSYFSAKTDQFTLTLTIDDINDHSPECSPLFYSEPLSEDATGQPTIVTLACTDDDATDPNNDLSYTIVSGSE